MGAHENAASRLRFANLGQRDGAREGLTVPTESTLRHELQALKTRMLELQGERDALSTLVNRNRWVSCRARARGSFRPTYVSEGVTAMVGHEPLAFTENGML
jgi:hypothetical protein